MDLIFQEGGLIETVSAMTLFVAGMMAFIRFPGLRRLYIPTVFLLLAEREFDAEVYAEDSFLFQILDGLDWLLGLTSVQVALAAVVFVGLIRHGIPGGWQAVKERDPSLSVFLLAVAVAVIAQMLEAISRAYGAAISDQVAFLLFATEETLEMFFAIGVLTSVLMGWLDSKRP